jgi:hypothetical protein
MSGVCAPGAGRQVIDLLGPPQLPASAADRSGDRPRSLGAVGCVKGWYCI